eukprot:2248097-Alexandrium_andersonii.AAC.1
MARQTSPYMLRGCQYTHPIAPFGGNLLSSDTPRTPRSTTSSAPSGPRASGLGAPRTATR